MLSGAVRVKLIKSSLPVDVIINAVGVILPAISNPIISY